MRLFHYHPVFNVPKGVELCDARDVLAEDKIFYTESPSGRSPANFSDVFRYAMLQKYGGWWFDMDVVSLKPAKNWPLRSLPTFASTFEGEWGECASNCCIFMPSANHPIADLLLNTALERQKNEKRDFCDLGPFLVQHVVKNNDMTHVASYEEFCPYPWRIIDMLVYKTLKGRTLNLLRAMKHAVRQHSRSDFKMGRIQKNTLAIHLHNEIFMQKGIDKNGQYHPACGLEKLYRRFEVIPVMSDTVKP